MRFVCFGYIAPGKLDAMSPTERQQMLDGCFAYDDQLRANGHFAAGEVLQGPEAARTLSWANGRLVVTDGPYAETKEQVGGFLLLQARDMEHAIQLVGAHPALRNGPWEIRPAADLDAMLEAGVIRRGRGSGD